MVRRVLVALFAFYCGVAVGCAKTQTQPKPEFPKPVQSDAKPPPAQPAELAAQPTSATDQSSSATGPAGAASPALTGGALNDGQIAKIGDVVHSGEIDQAQLARQRSKNAKVKNFASHMLKEHTQAKEQSASLLKASEVVPEQSAVSQELASEGARTLDALKAADAAGFDRQYIDAQVTQHQNVLSMLNTQLVPQATDAKLKAELQKVQKMVEAHLSEAKKLAETL